MGKTRSGQATRDRIVRAAMDRFARSGFERTSLRTIAEDAGISETAIYRHFPGKDALVDEILERKVAEAPVGLPDDAIRRADDRSVLRELARSFLWRIEEDDAFMRLLLWSALEGRDLADRFFERHALRVVDLLAGWIGCRRKEGAFRPDLDPPVAARLVLGSVFHFMTVRRLFGDETWTSVDLDRVADQLAGLALEGLRNREEDAPDG